MSGDRTQWGRFEPSGGQAAPRITDGGRVINIGTSLLGATTGLYSVYADSTAPLDDVTRALAKGRSAAVVSQ
ncbi:MAG: hypothetical protein JOZ47_23645 [Kutzneria sp.]|nr:hypothetical protein [Kutzneria sp.]